MFKNTFLLICLTMILASETSAQTQLLTPELLWKIGRVGLECVSPDGQLAVYGVQRYEVAANKGSRALFTVNLSTGETRRLTDFEKTSGDAEFHPGGQKLGFLMDGNLYEVTLNGLAAPTKVSDVEINGFHYSPDGKQVLFCKDVKLDKTPGRTVPGIRQNLGQNC
jgi:Tol biopolymer transport system component